MAPHFRIKTKLVVAISSMVMLVVAALSAINIVQMVRQRIDYFYQEGELAAHLVFNGAKDAILAPSGRPEETDIAKMDGDAVVRLQADDGMSTIMQGIVGYSSTIYDVAIAAPDGTAIVHSDLYRQHNFLPRRENFAKVRNGNFVYLLKAVYGKPEVYDISLPLERKGHLLGTIRVGVSTVFVKSDIQPQVNHALVFGFIAMLLSVFIAAGLSNFALRPLEIIGRRLDLQLGQVTPKGEPGSSPAAGMSRRTSDEVGQVTTKIDRLGQEVRDVQEVFSALKENLDQIMANLQDGVMLFNNEKRALLVSASVEHFVGKLRRQMLGHEVQEIFDQESALSTAVIRAFEDHAALVQRELPGITGKKTGVSLDFIEDNGQHIGALLTLRDAESVRTIEDEIELSRRLSAIGRLTSGVAHEVKNPINAIVVHLEVLREKFTIDNPEVRRHMNVIDSEIHHLDRVVQTLVDFTRPVELNLAPTDLASLVAEVLELAGPDAQRHGVKLISFPVEEALPVKVDADLVRQALLNIVLNGVQAMPRGGILTVHALRRGAEGVIEIRDQGKGIPAEIREKIFNLYFTTKKEGTGIGLPMAYRVMQLHNGSVDFESTKIGTTFRLHFALAATSAGQKSISAVTTV